MNPNLRRTLTALGTLTVLLAAFHGVENVRGWRAWQKRKAAQETLGQRFDPGAFAPPPVTDADNFALAPIVAGQISGASSGDQWILPLAFTTNPPAGNYLQGQPWDPKAFELELHGQSLEAYLRRFDEPLAALAEAAARPGSRFPVNYGDVEDMPKLLNMRAMARVLRFRALARLQAGKTEAAMDDVVTSLRLIQHLRNEPHLISQLLRMAYVAILLQPVWEGLNAHAWDETQLARLNAALEPIDMLGPMRTSWRFERCITVFKWEQRAKGPVDGPYGLLMEPGAPPAPASQRLVRKLLLPRGWVFQNLCAMDELFEIGLLPTLDAGHRVHPERTPETQARYKALRLIPFGTPLSSPEFPAMVTQDHRVAKTQSFLDQARVAIALERFKLKHGHYPEALGDLEGSLLPKVPLDVITGNSLKYTRTQSGFTLYSVGWNGRDEGGEISPVTTKDQDPTRGDWVWARRK